MRAGTATTTTRMTTNDDDDDERRRKRQRRRQTVEKQRAHVIATASYNSYALRTRFCVIDVDAYFIGTDFGSQRLSSPLTLNVNEGRQRIVAADVGRQTRVLAVVTHLDASYLQVARVGRHLHNT